MIKPSLFVNNCCAKVRVEMPFKMLKWADLTMDYTVFMAASGRNHTEIRPNERPSGLFLPAERAHRRCRSGLTAPSIGPNGAVDRA